MKLKVSADDGCGSYGLAYENMVAVFIWFADYSPLVNHCIVHRQLSVCIDISSLHNSQPHNNFA